MLRILIDGEFYCSIALKSLGRQKKSGYVEVTDGNRVFISISPSQVSGATDEQDVLDAIKTAVQA